MTAAKKLHENAAATSAALSAPTLAAPLGSHRWNKRVLVVDDEPEIVSIYRDILTAEKNAPTSHVRSSRSHQVTPLPARSSSVEDQKFNFDVISAGSAQGALALVEDMKSRGESPAMGFFDVRLGEGMDGIELVREIHKIFPDMYAVFVTAYNDRTIDSINSVLGPARVDHWDYMNKPFNAAEITQKARNFVSLWNLQKADRRHAEVLADLNRKVLESERVTSVAAVARGVAHEFGNLLMQIMGKAEISRNKTPEEMQAALDKIIDASQRAHEILDRFNHLSDTKSQSTHKQMVCVGHVLDEAMDLMSHQFKKEDIKVRVLKKEPVMAKIHSTSLLQVLVNLFINAMHAMQAPSDVRATSGVQAPSDAHATKGSGQIEASLEKRGDHFEMVIRDYGPGIPDDLLEKVTEPFFTTKGDKGTGLGLAICREIIEIDHGGEFQLRNHSETGLEVVLRIPIGVEVERKGCG